MSITVDEIRRESWDKSIHALGTSHIFELKAKFYKKWIRIITVLGIVTPLLIGATVATYGADSAVTIVVLAVTGPVIVFQIVLSGISLSYKWDDQFAYALESQSENRVLAEDYEQLAKYPPSSFNDLEKAFSLLKSKDDARTKQDEKVNFSNDENRRGLRYALWRRQRQCGTCGKIPPSLAPSECLTCGSFKP